MIKVYRTEHNKEWKLMTTFGNDEAEDAKKYAASKARITKETHIVVYQDTSKPSDTFRGENDPGMLE